MNSFRESTGCGAGKEPRQIDQMIEVFALKPHLELSSGQLPLGFKQRLAMACALMHGPDVLFLDEPTSGVDPITRREFWSHINGSGGKRSNGDGDHSLYG